MSTLKHGYLQAHVPQLLVEEAEQLTPQVSPIGKNTLDLLDRKA